MDFYKILKGGVGVGMNNFDRLFAEKYGGGAWQLTTLTGALPLSFKSKGEALTDYKLYGTSNGSGVETESGEPTGYKLPMTMTSWKGSTTTPIYIGDSKLGAEEYVDYEEQKVYKQFEISGLSEPLCGIGTYTDNIDLSTGTLTRRIKKLVLTGEEGWVRTQNQRCYYINTFTGCPTDYLKQKITTSICSHYQSQNNTASGSNAVEAGHFCFFIGGGFELYIGETTISSAADFKTYLQQQYIAGTPVTLWYVLAEPETSTVSVPIGLAGTIDGYLIQDGTPTPETPIYPTANGEKQPNDTYSVFTIQPTDPPVPLPEIATYSGKNALSCSEALGEVSITGYIKGV